MRIFESARGQSMRIGDTIIITKGRYKGRQVKVLNVVYEKVMVRIDNIDVFIQTTHFVRERI